MSTPNTPIDLQPTTNPSAPRSRRARWIGGGVIALAVLAVAAYLFQPWALFTNTTVNESLPQTLPQPTATPSAATPPTTSPTITPASPQTLGSGTFRSYEHSTSGTAKLIKLADGRLFVRLEDFNTSNGPDVKVWLTAAAVDRADKSRDSAYVDLGDLKANNGNQNYEVPPGTKVTTYKSVVVWCDRFSVAFGAASITS
jgi:hypothetical protein